MFKFFCVTTLTPLGVLKGRRVADLHKLIAAVTHLASRQQIVWNLQPVTDMVHLENIHSLHNQLKVYQSVSGSHSILD